MKNVLVAGGAGFIGSHLCECLLGLDARVLCVDNFITGHRSNIEHLLQRKEFNLIETDICQEFSIEGTLDEIFHLASPASPKDYLSLPLETLMVGSFGTYWLLRLACQKKARFLLASTSEVYGDPQIHPQPESYWGNVNPVGPRSVYDESKRFSEALVMAFHRTHGLSTRIVRIFNTYGPRMQSDDGRVVSNFIVQALLQKPLSIYGDGSQTRSFCYVDDLVSGLLLAMERSDAEPVNLGNDEEYTIRELAQRIARLVGSSSQPESFPLPVDDPKVRKPNLYRAKSCLGYQPKITLEEGLINTIDYFRKRESSQ